MRDITLEDTIYIGFTTRAFATGIPTTLAGTPVVSAYEDAGLTQITAGITLGVDHDGVTGFHMLTIAATAANGYGSGQDYNLTITTGTVGGVSVVGEIVGGFTVGRSAAQTTIGTAGAGLTAINLPNQTMDITGNITGNVSGSVGSVTGAVGSVTGAVGSLAAQAKLDVNAECDTAMTDYDAPTKAEMDTAFTEIKGATWASVTDTLEAIRDRGDSAWTTGAGGSDRLLMVDTTIATLASQVSFTLTAGSTDNDAYNNCTIVIEDVSTATQKAVGVVSDYVGSTKTVTLKYDPAIFTMATTDKIYILAENALKSTAANRQLDVTATGAAGIDWGNVENPTTALDLSGTDIQLCDTTTTNTDMVGTDSAALASVCTESRLAELDAANLPADVAAIPTTAMRGTDSAATATALATAQTDLDTITGTAGVELATGQTAAWASALEVSAGTIKEGTAKAGTLSTTQMSTTMTEVDDVFNGRILIFKSDTATTALRLQATDITDYVSVNGVLTFTALTTAPGATDTFLIV